MLLLLAGSVSSWSAVGILLRRLGATRMNLAVLLRATMNIHSRKIAVILAQAVGRCTAIGEGDRRSDHTNGVESDQTDRRAKSQSLSQMSHADIVPDRIR
ncbi:MAG: hypothetical protein C0519_16665 [Hyphomicrobium sp.]|jgi:hypothetical protein|nr:hypothetical protein [Hyphomicrobium sp.]